MLGKSALWYARRLGWRVFPVRPGCKAPPLIKRWQHDASSDEAQIVAWWTQWPEANIALLCGPESGVWALDVDPRHGGDVWLEERLAGREIPETPRAQTPLKGAHYYFRWPLDKTIPPKSSPETGVDVRGKASYVVLPPSKREEGDYVWYHDARPGDVEFAQAPEWLIEIALPKTPLPTSLEPREGAPVAPPVADALTKGQRTPALASLAGTLRRRGMAKDEILAALRAVNAKRCDPPLQDKDLEHIAASMERYAPGAPIVAPDERTPEDLELEAAQAGDEHLTDLGNARRLVAIHGADLRYCHAWKAWLVWDGVRWRRDATGAVVRRAKDVAARIYAEAAKAPEGRRQALAKHALRTEDSKRIAAMVGLAQSEPEIPVTPADLDADPWTLATPNGTVDLRTGELREASREALCTRLAGVPYDPEATCPTWERFLGEVMGGNAALVDFLQRAAGYSLTGDTSEQALFLLHGAGRNGKSTFLETLRAVLGDYAQSTPFETFLARRGESGGASNDLAALKGSRLVTATEGEEGRRLNEAMVKQVTGGDTLTARFLYGEYFDFKPALKLWLASNHRPEIRGSDDGIWRRIRLVPFSVQIPAAQVDRRLPAKLLAEAPGIFAWAVRGCLAWQRDGLAAPEDVREATAEYRGEQDRLGSFLDDTCVLEEGSGTPSAKLYQAYREWATAAGEFVVTQTRFGRALAERGFGTAKYGGVKWRMGLRLKSDVQAESDSRYGD
jgi:putative DNA primase/helicase